MVTQALLRRKRGKLINEDVSGRGFLGSRWPPCPFTDNCEDPRWPLRRLRADWVWSQEHPGVLNNAQSGRASRAEACCLLKKGKIAALIDIGFSHWAEWIIHGQGRGVERGVLPCGSTRHLTLLHRDWQAGWKKDAPSPGRNRGNAIWRRVTTGWRSLREIMLIRLVPAGNEILISYMWLWQKQIVLLFLFFFFFFELCMNYSMKNTVILNVKKKKNSSRACYIHLKG